MRRYWILGLAALAVLGCVVAGCDFDDDKTVENHY